MYSKFSEFSRFNHVFKVNFQENEFYHDVLYRFYTSFNMDGDKEKQSSL